MKNDYDMIVIGGGITGLASSIFSAKENKKCLLIEKCPYVGGSIRGFYKNGVYYPYGLSLLGSLNDGELLDILLKYLEVEDEIELCDFHNKEIFTFIDENFNRISVSSNIDEFHKTLNQHFPENKDGLNEFFLALKKVSDENFLYKLKTSDENTYDHSNMLGFFLNTDDVLGERIKTFNPKLKLLLASFLFLFGVFPEDTPFFVFSLIVGSYLSGTKYIKDGGIKLVNALEKKMAELNVDVKTNERVTKFECNESKITKVITNKGTYTTKDVIFTGEPNTLLSLIDENHLNHRFTKKIKNYEVGMSIFATYFEVEDESLIKEEDYYRNYMYVKDIPNTYEDFKKMSIEDILDRVINILTNYDNGKFHIYAVIPQNYKDYLKFINNKNEEYYKLKRKNEEFLTKRIESIFPEFKGKLKPVLSFTPLTVVDYLEHTNGSIFGMYASAKQKGINSIFPITPIKNLYLAGQNIVLPGVLGSLVSALLFGPKLYGKDFFNKIKSVS